MRGRVNRAVLVAGGLGVLGALGWVLVAVLGGQVMPSYLGAWLFGLGVPMGALPLVMALEWMGAEEAGLLGVLRRVLLLLPAGVVLAVPVLVMSGGLFGVQAGHGIPGWWVAPGLLVTRAVVMLAAVAGLAVVFSRTPRRPRMGLAVLGGMVYAAVASVAAVDWVLAVQPGLGSSLVGLLLMLAQAGLAASLAGFVVAVRTPRTGRVPAPLATMLALLLAAWAFVHFVQFLTIWSANLPEEASWYLARSSGLGGFGLGFGAASAVLGCAVLPTPLGRVPMVLATVAAMVLLAHLGEAFWLVTPAFRGVFRVTGADVLAAMGVGGLLLALLLALVPRDVLPTEARHAA